MEIIALAKRLVSGLKERRFSGNYKYESDLEEEVYSIFRKIIKAELHLKGDKKLNDIIITHGKEEPEKERWTATKGWQDVIIAGCRNTSDIVIKLPGRPIDQDSPKHCNTIAVQLKYAKNRITGAIQTIVGQCLIASLRHSTVIGIVLSKKKIEAHEKERITNLADRLEKYHKVFLIVRDI